MSELIHDPARHRFSIEVDGHEAELVYVPEDGAIAIVHTGVPPEIGGRGIAGDLVKAALEFARNAGLKVKPRCEYAAAYLKRHREYDDLVV
ncbi:GNAT family N-acetyltransferase [Luteimonas galliterrae]|uniref:GNAT family N-acetyltransferase n=1 Tax=Luteimonas galliterrae TaxID=2940486 RepID=UPI003CE4BD6A